MSMEIVFAFIFGVTVGLGFQYLWDRWIDKLAECEGRRKD